MITAPYNFVPLAPWVHRPSWASQVSQDIPFKDGLCGHLELRITACSPLLVGGEQEPATDESPGVVRPFRLPGPDGGYALPGTTLKGMIRAVVEVASFSRMSLVDDQRLSLRDLTSPARPFYGDFMTRQSAASQFQANSQAGWLHFDTKRKAWMLEPCHYSRVEQADLDTYAGNNWFQDTKSARKTARDKYAAWPLSRDVKFDPGPVTAHRHSCGWLVYSKASCLGTGATMGTLVFTGQPSPKKHLEFIFHGSRGRPVPVPEAVFRGFLDIHDPQSENIGGSTDWAFWRDQPRVPVFYLEDPKVPGSPASLGLALMYKLAYRHSLHEAIAHTSPDHLNEEIADFATTLFGKVGATPEQALKGRVMFHHALAANAPTPEVHAPTILNGPKPSYYPNYIRQPYASNGQLPQDKAPGKGYQTLMSDRSELRGWKRYPVRPLDTTGIQPLTGEQLQNPRVQVRLHTLPVDTTFQGRMTFHNLKPEELGALCWALTWAEQEDLRHSLGMGKPFGFGQVAIAISAADIRPNRAEETAPTWQACCARFIAYMEDAAKHHKGWRNSPQIGALLGMANPAKAAVFPGDLRHMRLTTGGQNEFKDAKERRWALPDYPQGLHPQPALPGGERITWTNVELKLNPGNGELSILHEGKTAFARNTEAQALRDRLPEDLKARLKAKRALKSCTVEVKAESNSLRLVAILAVGENPLPAALDASTTHQGA